MQPTIKELEEKYNKMRDDQILSLLEDEEGMRTEALKILKKIAKEKHLNTRSASPKDSPDFVKIRESGRIGRKTYLTYLLFYYGFLILFSNLSEWVFKSKILGPFFLILLIIFWVNIIIQSNYRCHDVGKSGFFQLVPLYFILLIFKPGDKGVNKYGQPPQKEKI